MKNDAKSIDQNRDITTSSVPCPPFRKEIERLPAHYSVGHMSEPRYYIDIPKIVCFAIVARLDPAQSRLKVAVIIDCY